MESDGKMDRTKLRDGIKAGNKEGYPRSCREKKSDTAAGRRIKSKAVKVVD